MQLQLHIDSGQDVGNNLPLPRFPSTRYQGSKRKVLELLAEVFRDQPFSNAMDLFSGSGMVTLLLRHLGKDVSANDYLRYNSMTAGIFIGAKRSDFDQQEFEETLAYLLNEAPFQSEKSVQRVFGSILS